MSDEEPETEATASPDDGEFSIDDVDPGDLEAYVADEKTWKTKQNRTNQEAAEARQKYVDKLEELTEANASREATPAPQADPNATIYPLERFMSDIKADDVHAEVTVGQMWQAVEGLSRFGVLNFRNHFGDVEYDDSGRPNMTVAEAYRKAETAIKKSEGLATEVEGFFTGMWVNELADKFEFADQADILSAIKAADTSDPDYTGNVEEAVKAVHDRVAKHVSTGEAKGKNKKTRMPRHTGSKRGGKAVTGERELNIYDKRDRQEMHRLGMLQVPGE